MSKKPQPSYPNKGGQNPPVPTTKRPTPPKGSGLLPPPKRTRDIGSEIVEAMEELTERLERRTQ